jgi:hypothetical protein
VIYALVAGAVVVIGLVVWGGIAVASLPLGAPPRSRLKTAPPPIEPTDDSWKTNLGIIEPRVRYLDMDFRP